MRTVFLLLRASLDTVDEKCCKWMRTPADGGERESMGRYVRETRTPREKLRDTINMVIAVILTIIASALVVLLVFLFYENMKGS